MKHEHELILKLIDYYNTKKFPTLNELCDFIGWAPDESHSIRSTYEATKKLGGF